MRKVVLLAAAIVVALGTTVSSATSASSETGITARTITIGGSFPLTGPASAYATIPTAMKAYFAYVNARKGPDGKRGIYGRQIVFKMYDDAYNPAQTVQQSRRLVEEDKVFAVVGQLGTETNEAARQYLNQRKVPQILNGSGATEWYTPANVVKYPWTRGWFPDYEFETNLFGQSIARNSPNAKIAVLYQNDSAGDDWMRGLKAGLGNKVGNIVAQEGYEPTAPDVRSQVARLKASGAQVLVILATPKFMIQCYAVSNLLGWKPSVVYTTLVSATDTFLTLAQRSGGGDLVNNTLTASYLKDPANPKWDNDAGMKLYKEIMAKYDPSGNIKDSTNFYGVAAAQAFEALMYKAGKNPTRASLMKAFGTWTENNPFLLPGNKVKTKGVGDQRPVDCLQLQRFTNGTFQPVSALKCRSGKGT
jgi:branched-chain amino acid transport system substrate-binding protein